MKAPLINPLLRGGRVLPDGSTDVDTVTLNETAAADSIANLFDGDLLLGSAQTDAASVPGFTHDTSEGGANSFTTTAPVDAGPVVGSGSSAATVIRTGGTVELTSAYSGTVSFAGA